MFKWLQRPLSIQKKAALKFWAFKSIKHFQTQEDEYQDLFSCPELAQEKRVTLVSRHTASTGPLHQLSDLTVSVNLNCIFYRVCKNTVLTWWKPNVLCLWKAPAPNSSDHVSPNTCHCTLVLDIAEPGAGQHCSCKAPAGIWTSRMMSITQNQFLRCLHHGHTPTTEAKSLSPPLWPVVTTGGAGGTVWFKRTALGDRAQCRRVVNTHAAW